MATVRILRGIWRLRRYAPGVCVVALLAGVFATHTLSFPPKSKSYDVGVATAQILVDTPQSQVVGDSSSVSAAGAQTLGTLGVQANLLAGLMVEGPIKTDIAQRAGLKPNHLIGSSAAVSVPSASGSGSTSAASSVSIPSGQNVYALTTQILTDSAGQNTLPIIEIDAQAPDEAKAVRLANAAVAGLQDFVNSEAAVERIPDGDRLSITSLGISQAGTQTHGPSQLIGVLVALVVLLLGFASIHWVKAVIRGLRRASERERLGLPLEDEPEWAPYVPASPIEPELGPVVATNGMSQRHFPTNGVSGRSNHGDPAPAADFPGFPTADTSGQDPASPSRQFASRRWLAGRADSGLDRRRPIAVRQVHHRHRADSAEGKLIPLLTEQPSGQPPVVGNDSSVGQQADEPRTVSRDQRTVSRDQRTVSRDQRTVSRDQPTVSRDQPTVSRDQPTVSRDQASHETP
jgi:hypothetical protein